MKHVEVLCGLSHLTAIVAASLEIDARAGGVSKAQLLNLQGKMLSSQPSLCYSEMVNKSSVDEIYFMSELRMTMCHLSSSNLFVTD